MHNRSSKYLLIKRIVILSKELHEMFNTEILTEFELNLMNTNDLLNVETELRVQIGLTSTNFRTVSFNSAKK